MMYSTVPSRRDPKLILAVVLPLFGSHLLGNKSKMSGGASLMGAAAGQKWQFPPRAYMGVLVQTSALIWFVSSVQTDHTPPCA